MIYILICSLRYFYMGRPASDDFQPGVELLVGVERVQRLLRGSGNTQEEPGLRSRNKQHRISGTCKITQHFLSFFAAINNLP